MKRSTAKSAPQLYKVVIQGLVYGNKPNDERRLRARRVVVVNAETIAKGVEHLRDVLTQAGAFNDTSGEIVSVEPAGSVVTLSTFEVKK